MTALRALLLGAGGFGMCWWEAIRTRSDVVVAGAVDPDPQVRARVAETFGLEPEQVWGSDTDDWESLGCDLVIDCSPFPFHAEHGARAMRAGRHYLVAKPMAVSRQEVTALTSASRENRVVLAVLQQMRHFGCFQTLRQLVRDSEFGSVIVAEVAMALDGRGWEPGIDWRLALEHPLLYEAGVHHLDLLRYVLGQEFRPASVTTWRTACSPFVGHDTCAAHLVGSQGTSVVYRASFAPEPDPMTRFDSGWSLYCERGTIKVRDGSVRVRTEQGEIIELLARRDEPEPLEVLNSRLLEEILTALARGEPPPCDAEDNARTMDLLLDLLATAEGV